MLTASALPQCPSHFFAQPPASVSDHMFIDRCVTLRGAKLGIHKRSSSGGACCHAARACTCSTRDLQGIKALWRRPMEKAMQCTFYCALADVPSARSRLAAYGRGQAQAAAQHPDNRHAGHRQDHHRRTGRRADRAAPHQRGRAGEERAPALRLGHGARLLRPGRGQGAALLPGVAPTMSLRGSMLQAMSWGACRWVQH